MGEANPSDLLTKHVSESKKDKHCEALSMSFQDGRASTGLKMQHGAIGNDAKAL